MSDWFSASIKLQKQMLDAQRASLEAGQKMLGATDQLVKMQEAGKKAADANIAAWSAWSKMWGLK